MITLMAVGWERDHPGYYRLYRRVRGVRGFAIDCCSAITSIKVCVL